METKTEELGAVKLELTEGMTVEDVHQILHQKFHWLAPEKCER